MLDLKPVFDKLREQTEMLRELLNVVRQLTQERIKDIDKISEIENEKFQIIEDNKKMYSLLNSIAHRKGTKMVDAKQIRDCLRNIKEWE